MAWVKPSLGLGANQYITQSFLKVWMERLASLCVFTHNFINACLPLSPYCLFVLKAQAVNQQKLLPRGRGAIYGSGQHFSSDVAWLFTMLPQSRDRSSRCSFGRIPPNRQGRLICSLQNNTILHLSWVLAKVLL